MYIGNVAKTAGLTPDAIRFYERKYLLPRPPRSEGGFRQYTESNVEMLAFIRQVQALGFTLTEVRGLVDLRRGELQPCARVGSQLQEKLVQIRRKRAALETLEQELRAALRICNAGMRRRPNHCPLPAKSGGKNRRG
jgi:DNA-binding transcriptional MerR regulator